MTRKRELAAQRDAFKEWAEAADEAASTIARHRDFLAWQNSTLLRRIARLERDLAVTEAVGREQMRRVAEVKADAAERIAAYEEANRVLSEENEWLRSGGQPRGKDGRYMSPKAEVA